MYGDCAGRSAANTCTLPCPQRPGCPTPRRLDPAPPLLRACVRNSSAGRCCSTAAVSCSRENERPAGTCTNPQAGSTQGEARGRSPAATTRLVSNAWRTALTLKAGCEAARAMQAAASTHLNFDHPAAQALSHVGGPLALHRRGAGQGRGLQQAGRQSQSCSACQAGWRVAGLGRRPALCRSTSCSSNHGSWAPRPGRWQAIDAHRGTEHQALDALVSVAFPVHLPTRGLSPPTHPPRCHSRRQARCLPALQGLPVPSPCRRARCCKQRGASGALRARARLQAASTSCGDVQAGKPPAWPTHGSVRTARGSGRAQSGQRRVCWPDQQH